MITAAVAATRYIWGDPPPLGIITCIDPAKTRHKRDPGRCFRKAGWRKVGVTKERRLIVFQQLLSEMPDPDVPLGMFALGLTSR